MPILEAPPLARALFTRTPSSAQEIPEKLYTAVAEVLAYVFQLRHHERFGGPERPLGEVEVPAELDPQAVAHERARAASGVRRREMRTRPRRAARSSS